MCDSGTSTISSGGPAAITSPPASPPSGPRSTTQSACLITSRLCSITSTVLPLLDQAVQHLEQLLDVGQVQARGGLVEHVQRAAGGDLLQLGGELDALRLAARQRRRGLAEPDVVEADVVQRLQAAAQLRDLREELERLLDRHLEHVGDRLALEPHLERLAVVALALADLARDVDVGQEVHLDLDGAVAAARLAAAALDVEREPARLVAAHLGVGRRRDRAARIVVEQSGVGGRVRPRRAADRATGRCRSPCRTSRCPRCGRARPT